MRPDFRNRVRNLQKLIKRNRLGAAMLTDPSDIFYYTGLDTDDSAFLVVDTDSSKPKLFVSPLNNNAEGLKTADVSFLRDLKEIRDLLKRYGPVGFDERNLNVHVFSRLRQGTDLRPACCVIREPRMVKDSYELRQIRKAVGITLGILGELGTGGKTELEIAAEIENRTREAGLCSAFPPIVSSGKNSFFIHTKPTKRRIKSSDLVILDMGVRYNGYCSDITRTLCLRPDKRQKKIMEDISLVQGEIIGSIKDGAGFNEIEGLYEKLMEKHGYRVFHSFGHGIGLSPHERPLKGDVLREGMVLTVEPGVYIRNFGGCRIEDMILVKRNRAEVLSTRV